MSFSLCGFLRILPDHNDLDHRFGYRLNEMSALNLENLPVVLDDNCRTCVGICVSNDFNHVNGKMSVTLDIYGVPKNTFNARDPITLGISYTYSITHVEPNSIHIEHTATDITLCHHKSEKDFDSQVEIRSENRSG